MKPPRGPLGAAKRRQNMIEAALPRYASRRAEDLDASDLARLLRLIASKLEKPDTAKVFELIGQAGINVDDFAYMLEQIGLSLAGD